MSTNSCNFLSLSCNVFLRPQHRPKQHSLGPRADGGAQRPLHTHTPDRTGYLSMVPGKLLLRGLEGWQLGQVFNHHEPLLALAPGPGGNLVVERGSPLGSRVAGRRASFGPQTRRLRQQSATRGPELAVDRVARARPGGGHVLLAPRVRPLSAVLCAASRASGRAS
jgi:hypothetical protein